MIKGLVPLVISGNLSFAFGMLLIGTTDSFYMPAAAVFCSYGYGEPYRHFRRKH